MKRTAAAASVLVLIGVTALAGCSSSGSAGDVTAAVTTSAQAVGGTAVCDEASLRTSIEDNLAADPGTTDEKVFDISEFRCEDGWAVAFADVGTTSENAVTVTDVFEAEGQLWLLKDRGDVCGTLDDNDITKRPDDAQVPAGIWQDACATN